MKASPRPESQLGSLGGDNGHSDAQSSESARPVQRGRLTANFLSNVASFGLSTVIGIWFTPFLIRHLGIAAYSLIPLATTVTSYMLLITLGLNSAVGRFITVALEQGDEEMAGRAFNTSLFGSLLLALTLLGPGLWMALHIDRFLHVPAGYEFQMRWLFIATVSAFLLNEVITPFEVSTFCRNRFDLRSLGNSAQNLMRVGVVVLMFSMTVPRIWHVGLGILSATILSGLYAVPMWRVLTPNLHIRPRQFNWSMLKSLTSFGMWTSIQYLGGILLLSIDLVVVNRLLGPHEGGRYAAVLQWSVLLRGLTMTVSSVFGPTIMSLYARNDTDGMIRYAQQAVKFVGLIIALPVGLICGLSYPLLSLWLGPEFASLALLMSLLTGHLSFNLGYQPVSLINQATKHNRWPAVAALIAGVVNLGLALFLAGPMHWGVYGVASAGAIVLTIRNSFFMPIYAAHVVGKKYDTFLREKWPCIGATCIVAGLGWLASSMWHISTWSHLFATGLGISILYIVVTYCFLLTEQERKVLSKMLPGARA